jgi:hypothetical protein
MMSQFLVNTNLKIISIQYLKQEEFNKSVFPLFLISFLRFQETPHVQTCIFHPVNLYNSQVSHDISIKMNVFLNKSGKKEV